MDFSSEKGRSPENEPIQLTDELGMATEVYSAARAAIDSYVEEYADSDGVVTLKTFNGETATVKLDQLESPPSKPAKYEYTITLPGADGVTTLKARNLAAGFAGVSGEKTTNDDKGRKQTKALTKSGLDKAVLQAKNILSDGLPISPPKSPGK